MPHHVSPHQPQRFANHGCVSLHQLETEMARARKAELTASSLEIGSKDVNMQGLYVSQLLFSQHKGPQPISEYPSIFNLILRSTQKNDSSHNALVRNSVPLMLQPPAIFSLLLSFLS